MPRISAGTHINTLTLPAIDGTDFDLSQVQGKRFMLSFFRFASCPFCNLRVHQLVTRFEEFSDNFTIVAVFDSPLDNLQKQATGHHAPFPILADADNRYYRQFGVERSILKTLKGAVIRFPSLLYAMCVKGYLPLSFKGNITTMPLDILVNEHGIVEKAYYGKDEGDHLAHEDIVNFANGIDQSQSDKATT